MSQDIGASPGPRLMYPVQKSTRSILRQEGPGLNAQSLSSVVRTQMCSLFPRVEGGRVWEKDDAFWVLVCLQCQTDKTLKLLRMWWHLFMSLYQNDY